jgi:hypothetical protein
MPSNGGVTQPQQEEWVVTMTNGLVSKIERLDPQTQTRQELSADEYSALAAPYYAVYYAGIRDYSQAIASDDRQVAQAYYQAMTQYLGALGQG